MDEWNKRVREPSVNKISQNLPIFIYDIMENSGLGFIFQDLDGVASGRPRAWLRITGADAATFLQGQCTQELRDMKPGEARWALWLTIKGRVSGESLMLRGAGEEWRLWSAHTEGAALRARLEDFIIADEVNVEELGAGAEEMTLAGEAAEAWLRAERGGAEPPAEGAWVEFKGGVLFAGRRGLARVWDWVRPVGAGGAVVSGLGELRPEVLVRARLAAGVAAIPGEFGPADLPQEAGLETVAISFTKGCYLGQEVMARLHAMGQVRRRLVRVAGMGEEAVPAVGAGLHQGAKRVGEVRAAVADGRGGWLGLAMVNLLGLDVGGGLAFAVDGAATVRVIG